MLAQKELPIDPTLMTCSSIFSKCTLCQSIRFQMPSITNDHLNLHTFLHSLLKTKGLECAAECAAYGKQHWPMQPTICNERKAGFLRYNQLLPIWLKHTLLGTCPRARAILLSPHHAHSCRTSTKECGEKDHCMKKNESVTCHQCLDATQHCINA